MDGKSFVYSEELKSPPGEDEETGKTDEESSLFYKMLTNEFLEEDYNEFNNYNEEFNELEL